MPPSPVTLFLVAAPGTEALVATEARAQLEGTVEQTDGGVTVTGPPVLVMRANLHMRLPTRVLVRLGDVEARDFGKLKKGIAALPLREWLPEGAPIRVRASASRCRLYHTGALADSVAEAAVATIGARIADTDEAFDLLLRGHRDRFTLSLDTSGALLHQRGWRLRGGAAPLRETLAAALLALAGYDGKEALCDPMCGSGTIAIEAALVACHRAPGLGRTFAFERFTGHEPAAWELLARAARGQERAATSLILAADSDDAQLEAARENARRAGVAIELERTSIAELRPRAASGLVATNPPYGKRVGDRRTLDALYATVGKALRGPFAAWRAAVLLEDPQALTRRMQLSLVQAAPLSNGGLRVWVGGRGISGDR